MTTQSIFEVKVYACNAYGKSYYPEHSYWMHSSTLFPTFEEAESFIKNYNNQEVNILCYRIYERPIGIEHWPEQHNVFRIHRWNTTNKKNHEREN